MTTKMLLGKEISLRWYNVNMLLLTIIGFSLILGNSFTLLPGSGSHWYWISGTILLLIVRKINHNSS